MMKTYSDKKLTSFSKSILVLMGIAIAGINIFSGNYLNSLLGIFILYLSSFEKKVSISEEALVIEMTAFKTHHIQEIKFEDVEAIRIERLRNKSFVHFIKNNAGRKIEIDEENISQIKEWVRKKNKKLL